MLPCHRNPSLTTYAVFLLGWCGKRVGGDSFTNFGWPLEQVGVWLQNFNIFTLHFTHHLG
jgi:hypothetical protein